MGDVGLERRELGLNVRSSVGEDEAAGDLVEGAFVGDEGRLVHGDMTGPRRRDRRDLARERAGERRQPILNRGNRVGDHERDRRRIRIRQLADRGRIAGQLRDVQSDRFVVGNRDRFDIGVVEMVEARRDVRRRVGDGETADDLIERRLIGR